MILLPFINTRSKRKRTANQNSNIFCLHCTCEYSKKKLLDNYTHELKKVNNARKKQEKDQNFEASKLKTNLECFSEMCYISTLAFEFRCREIWQIWRKPPCCHHLKCLHSYCVVVSSAWTQFLSDEPAPEDFQVLQLLVSIQSMGPDQAQCELKLPETWIMGMLGP